ncbi:hypothetical protein QVD17_33352 [Tagetes erecta]|uniref:Reverse transcriptase zinc-binding domain-containing protein n=1 Tax=Tagetes erecta TaxID=13708 RepID=A0AAD8K352_TARER|nr:hypothetical protein QVD17_33352 [Tagetes erecta]
MEACKALVSSCNFRDNIDMWRWDGGDFMVKQVRRKIEMGMFDEIDSLIPWTNLVPLKVNFFAWCAGLGRIACRDNLAKRGVIVNASCDECHFSGESVDHVLLRCGRADEVWSKILVWCKAPSTIFLTIDRYRKRN